MDSSKLSVWVHLLQNQEKNPHYFNALFYILIEKEIDDKT